MKILKHMIADISMIAYKKFFLCKSANISKLLRLFLLIYDKNKKTRNLQIFCSTETILIIELKTSCGTIGLEASLKFKGKRPRVKGTGNSSSQCESSRYLLVVLFCTSKDASLQHVLVSLRVNYSH